MITTVFNLRGRVAHFAMTPGVKYIGRSGWFGTSDEDAARIHQITVFPTWLKQLDGRRFLLDGDGFGNPYRAGKDGTLEDVLYRYGQSLDICRAARVLKGLKLLCWCCDSASPHDPLRCHAQIVARKIEGIPIMGDATPATLFEGK